MGLYFEAALMLAKDSKYIRAREIASRADNLDKRAVVLTYINRQEAEDLIKRGELFSASRVIERIEDPELRVEAIVSFAKSGRKKEPDLTRNLLEDTRKLLERMLAQLCIAVRIYGLLHRMQYSIRLSPLN